MPDAGLRRELGVWSAASIVVGTIIGSGIFVVPYSMIHNVGTPAMVFVVWVAGGLLSLTGALTYAEMASAMPEAGGEYVFLREAYGPFWGFLYGWTQMWVAKAGSIATMATGFFYYFANFRPELDHVFAQIPMPVGAALPLRWGQLLAIATILGLAFLNYFGVKLGGRVQVTITAAKLSLFVGVIVIGLSAGAGNAANFHTSFPAAGGVAGFFGALVAALWAYDGWNNVSMVSSEIKNPQRSLPWALIAGTAACMAVYLLINLAYFYVLPAGAVAGTQRVAAEMMRRIFGAPGAAAVSLAAMVSILAALNGSILSGSRVPYAMARDGLFFGPFRFVHPHYATPGVSILGLCAWACLLVLTGTFEQLATYVIFASWILYSMTAAAVFVLRRKRPEMPRPYRVVGYPVLPFLFVLVGLLLLGATLLKSPRESILGLGLIALGVPFYLRWRGRKV